MSAQILLLALGFFLVLAVFLIVIGLRDRTPEDFERPPVRGKFRGNGYIPEGNQVVKTRNIRKSGRR